MKAVNRGYSNEGNCNPRVTGNVRVIITIGYEQNRYKDARGFRCRLRHLGV